MKPNILIIVGTVRQGRVGRNIADWYINEASKAAPDMSYTLLDVADLDLPIFHEAVPPMMHQYSSVQEQVAKHIAGADGFIFVTGEYNHSVPGSLKNFLDYLNTEWHHKAAAYVGYGTIGGVRSIEHLVQIMAELRVASVRDHLFIHGLWSAFDEQGKPKPDHIIGDITKQLTELNWWVKALQAARVASKNNEKAAS